MYQVIELSEYIDPIGNVQVRIGENEDDITLTIEGTESYLTEEQFKEFAKTIAKFNREVQK